MKEILLIVLGFGFLIFVHELGHFLVAKWVGIRCPQFAIGFGHAICSWRKGVGFRIGSTEKEFQTRAIQQLKADGVKPLGVHASDDTDRDAEEALEDAPAAAEDSGRFYTAEQLYEASDKMGLSETEYRLNYLPLGGYVKMLGQEDIDPNAKSNDPRAYNNKPIWARACVISAGVVMNIIFGALFLTAAFMIGKQSPSATVGYVAPGMPASTAFAQGHDDDLRYLGLQVGDRIVGVNGKAPEEFTDVVIATALGSRNRAVELQVERRGEAEPLTFSLTPERERNGERLLSVGFMPGLSTEIIYELEGEGETIDWLNGQMEAHPASSRTRDQAIRISRAGQVDVTNYSDVLAAFDASNGYPVNLTLTDPADNSTFDTEVGVLPTFVRYPEGPANLLGLVPAGKVIAVSEDMPVAEAGLKVGDILVQLGDLEWPSTTLQISDLLQANGRKPLALVVQRDGETVDLGEVTPTRKLMLGLAIEPIYDSTLVASVVEGSPADDALNQPDRFIPGTRITQVNGQAVETWADLQRVLVTLAQGEASSAQVTLTYEIPMDGTQAETVDLALAEQQVQDLRAASWMPDYEAFQPGSEMITRKADGIGQALVMGADSTRDFVVQTYITLLRLIQGDVKLYNLRGPVGIVHVGTTVAKQGWPYFLFFLGLISVNLAVINFLPIPIVDGGHMVFLAIEKVTGAPPSPKVMNIALYMGLAVIGFVFVMTLFYDVTRLVTGG
ncbi:MAG: site-2 protease family protein [Phycisphaerales bacterium JB063]